MTKMKCPHCGWEYNPELWTNGFTVVPDHETEEDQWADCLGSQQCPLNAEAYRRPLRKDGGEE
jgi:rubredoxin